MKKCKKCGAPLEGFLYKTIGKLMGIKPSEQDPEICNKCAEVAEKETAPAEEAAAPETPAPEAPAEEVTTPAEEAPSEEEEKKEEPTV